MKTKIEIHKEKILKIHSKANENIEEVINDFKKILDNPDFYFDVAMHYTSTMRSQREAMLKEGPEAAQAIELVFLYYVLKSMVEAEVEYEEQLKVEEKR